MFANYVAWFKFMPIANCGSPSEAYEAIRRDQAETRAPMSDYRITEENALLDAS